MAGNREKAIGFLSQAQKELSNAGIPEQFLDLCGRIHQESWTTFFSSFGDDKGTSLSVVRRETGDVLLAYDIRCGKRQGFWLRCWGSVKSAYRSWKGDDTRVEILLTCEDITRLKDILRQL